MKVIAYASRGLLERDSPEKIQKKSREIAEEMKMHPDRYPKPISDNYLIGSEEWIRLYEGTEEQLANLTTRWVPEMLYRFVVILESKALWDAGRRMGLVK